MDHDNVTVKQPHVSPFIYHLLNDPDPEAAFGTALNIFFNLKNGFEKYIGKT